MASANMTIPAPWAGRTLVWSGADAASMMVRHSVAVAVQHV